MFFTELFLPQIHRKDIDYQISLITNTNHTVFRYQNQHFHFSINLIKIHFLLQDEVLAISDKVVIRANDLLTWMDRGSNWTCGLQASSNKSSANDTASIPSLKNTLLDFSDVNYEKGMPAMCFVINLTLLLHFTERICIKKKLYEI